MNRISSAFSKITIALIIAIGAAWWGLTPLAYADGGLTPAFILLTAGADARPVETAVVSRGGQVTHIFPNQALIARLPAPALTEIAALPAVAAVRTGRVELAEMDPFGPNARRLAGVWNSLISPQTDLIAAAQLDARHPEQHPDLLIAPDRPAGGLAIAGSSGRPGYYDTSTFMAGSVAVGIVLLESNGTVEASSEDWTTDEKQLVLNEIVNALNWWTNLKPEAGLTFVYDDHASSPLPTGVEPIRHSSFDYTYGEWRWIGDAMNALGYSSYSYFTQVRSYNDALRKTYNTDWAFTIFVVDSSNDADNKFADGYFAYAYLGGPFMVMTSGNNGYGPYNMDAVAAHEMGHIFNALDQYYSAAQSCTKKAGYLQIENQNSQYGGCSSNVTSIMRGQIYPYTTKAIDRYAAGQIGWRDSDGDGIIDPLDVSLPVAIDTFVQNDNAITVTGSAQIVPFPSPTGDSFTINDFSSIQYRLDGKTWQAATITQLDATGLNAKYDFSLVDIGAGMHTLEVAAVDSVGNMSAVVASRNFTVDDAVDGGLNTELYPSTGQTVPGVAYHSGGRAVIRVEYRVDNGPWQTATAEDGAFDSSNEPFVINLASVAATTEAQSVRLEARAIDETGYVELNTVSEEVQIGGGQQYSVFIPMVVRGL